MSLNGSLSSINLADIIQLVSNSRQTGRFVLTRQNGQVGYIYLKNGEILHAEVEEFRGEVTGRGFAVQCSVDSGEYLVEADSEALSRALWNLLDNGAKYSGESRTLELAVGRAQGCKPGKPSLPATPGLFPVQVRQAVLMGQETGRSAAVQ